MRRTNIIKCIISIVFLFSLDSWSFAQDEVVPSSEKLDDMTLHVIPQSHIDLSWWWRYDPNTIHVVVKHTLETAFDNMEKFPDYTFTFLQVPAIEPLEKFYSDLFYKLRYYVHNNKAIGLGLPNPGASGDKGRLAIGSGLYCEPDGCLPCGESLVRQCLYGKRWFKYQFDIDVKTGWFQDAWTHPWTYPQILKKSGIDSYMFTRPRGMMEDNMFWWESADGSRVFAYQPLAAGGENLSSPGSIDEYLLRINKSYGVKDGITLIGVGNHGGGAIAADVERMRQVMNERDSGKKQGKIIFSKPQEFVSAVLDNPNDFPVLKYEIEPTIRGAYTTVGEIKRGNRYSENLLMTLEKFSSISSVLGVNVYPGKSIYDSWKKLMINQFHDPISGTDILPSIDDVLLRFEQIINSSTELLSGQLRSITENIDTRGEGKAILVFNPLSWSRTDVVETEFALPEGSDYFSILDKNSQKVPVQIIEGNKEKGIYKYRVIFLAESIPSMGYSTYRLKPERNQVISGSSIKASRFLIENEFFSVQIDSLTGCVSGIIDKQNNREVLSAGSLGNLIQIIDDFGDSEGFLISPEGDFEFYKDGSYVRWTGNSLDISDYSEIEIIEEGPVRVGIQVKREFQMARFIQRLYLYSGIDRIDFELTVDWQGKNKMVKVAFPLNVQNDSATYEIPYGTIVRPSIGEEHVAQKWVDISERQYGVSLLNDSRYGHDITGNTIRLSVLRSPNHPVETLDDKGIHQIKYALYPHMGGWREGNVMQKGYEFNYPLIAVIEDSHEGIMPPRHSFIEISPDNLILTVLKKAEDSDDLILRFFETWGKGCRANVKLSKFLDFDAVHKTDLLENETERIPKDGQGFNVDVGQYSIESFKLIKDRD